MGINFQVDSQAHDQFKEYANNYDCAQQLQAFIDNPNETNLEAFLKLLWERGINEQEYDDLKALANSSESSKQVSSSNMIIDVLTDSNKSPRETLSDMSYLPSENDTDSETDFSDDDDDLAIYYDSDSHESDESLKKTSVPKHVSLEQISTFFLSGFGRNIENKTDSISCSAPDRNSRRYSHKYSI